VSRDRRPRGPLRKLADRSVNTKILISLTVSCLAMVGVAAIGISGMSQVSDTSHRLYHKSVVPMKFLSDLHDSQLKSRLDVNRVAVQSNDADRQEMLQTLHETDNDVATALQGYKRTSTQAHTEPMAQFDAAWAAYLAVRDGQLLPLALSGDATGFGRVYNEVAQPHIADAADALDALQVRETTLGDLAAKRADQTYRTGRIEIVVFLLTGIGLSFLLGQAVAALIVGPLRRTIEVLDAVADGDLTRTVGLDSVDEVGRIAAALDRANHRTRQVIDRFGGVTLRLLDVSSETNSTSSDIATRSTELETQADAVLATAQQVSDNLAVVASTTEEMSSSIAEVANHSSLAASVARNAVEAARATNTLIHRLGESSAKIDAVVKTITSIAEQTNLLALNATIEAARAGGAGKGFAVVASEVKDLAQETAAATHDITRRVHDIQTDTEGAVKAIAEIVRVVDRIAGYQQSVAAAVEQQTASAGEISRSITSAAAGSASIAGEISGVTAIATQTSNGVRRTRAAAAELARMSTELQALVHEFTV
jgi:methyl-accepting chemotaxis protein